MILNQRRRGPLGAAALLLGATALGCSDVSEPVDDVHRVAVAGTVSYDGKPLPEGKIQFQPLAGEAAGMAVGEIHEGRFQIEEPGGPSPGKYRVMISSRPAPTFKEGEAPGSSKLEPEAIPKKYNLQSKLEVDVPAEGRDSFQFDLGK